LSCLCVAVMPDYPFGPARRAAGRSLINAGGLRVVDGLLDRNVGRAGMVFDTLLVPDT